jgi:RNA polymerase-interacting CarD/CdnL/TRCF family regulator
MGFHIGDQIIHCAFGLGEITQIEKKTINGQLTRCYVVKITDMTVWVPVDDPLQNSLRLPTPPEEFVKVIPVQPKPCRKIGWNASTNLWSR